jgi:hypothetical protein
MRALLTGRSRHFVALAEVGTGLADAVRAAAVALLAELSEAVLAAGCDPEPAQSRAPAVTANNAVAIWSRFFMATTLERNVRWDELVAAVDGLLRAGPSGAVRP